MPLSQSSSRNILLSALTADDYAAIEGQLKRVPLPLRHRMQDATKLVEWVYFPEDGVGSVVASDAGGKQVEVGIFGCEGMSGSGVVLGADRASHDVFIQIEGVSGLRITTEDLKRAMADSVTLRAVLLLYVQTVLVQSSSSTAAAAGYTIEQRLARWLLMCHDRVDGDTVRLTHEFMSMMLGSRRAGVTVALKALEDRRLIVPARGAVLITDRGRLEHVAAGSYGFAETEYERLMGTSPRAGKINRLATENMDPTSIIH